MTESLFDRLNWRDPLSGRPLEPLVSARTPGGMPICGAMRIGSTNHGYPIVDCVVRLTPELAKRYRDWLTPYGLQPPGESGGAGATAEPGQVEASVDSFGFQWSWNSAMRSEADLRWRVAGQFDLTREAFGGRLALDAGAGAGDQSRWMLEQGAEVVSVDLSAAIDVVARKLREREGWVGVQGDIAALPFEEGQFGLVYCEGVIQHTQDSAATVRELARVVSPAGLLLATHYEQSPRFRGRVKVKYMSLLRRFTSRMDRYKLLLLTGNLAALSYLPFLRPLLRATGTALWYELMSDFRTTWTNTFDWYGTHVFQRHVTGQEFWSYFEAAGDLELVYRSGATVVARRRGSRAA